MKNFNEIYQKIHKENYTYIKLTRQKNIIRSSLITLIFIIVSIPVAINFSLLLAIVFDIVVSIVVFLNPFFNNYNKTYKSSIISSLVKNYDANLNYNPDSVIPKKYYDQADFEPYTEFNAEDYISGMIDGEIEFRMGDLHLIYVSCDDEGTNTNSTVFKGLFSASTLTQCIPDTIKIHLNKKITGAELKNEEKVNMDSQEFEKYFDVFSPNKILTMRILTSDIMDLLLNFRKEHNIKFEITIKQNMLYIRIHSKNLFESNILKNPFDFDTLYTYFKYLDFMIELNKKLNKILNEKDI